MSGTEAIRQAIKEAGGATTVAALFGINRGSVYGWIEDGRVPADRCPTIEKWTGGKVRCEELNDRVNWGYLRAQAEPEASHV